MSCYYNKVMQTDKWLSDYVQTSHRVQTMEHFYYKYRNKNIQKQIYRTDSWM